MVDLDLKQIVHELGDAAWCEGKNFEDWVEPRVNAILQALAERDALKAELEAEKENHRLHAARLISEKILVSEQLEAARKQEPVAYLHTLHMEFEQKSKRLCLPDEEDPFGQPGQDYSDCYPLTVEPLYASPVPAQQGNSEREEFNAWNNENSCPLAGRDPKTAAWMAWQARAQLAKVPAQQECTFHGADAQACMDYSKESPCEFTWEEEAKRAFWSGLEIGATFGSCAILPRWNEYIEKRKSELKGGENER